jgi:hypothetical protein
MDDPDNPAARKPRTRPDRVLADKAYSTRKIQKYLRKNGIKGPSPSQSTRAKAASPKGSKGGRPPRLDTEIYKSTRTATPSNRPSTNSAPTTPWLAAMTIETSFWPRNPTNQDPLDTP